MKTYSVRVTRQAREHLRSIKSYITNELLAPEAASNTVSRLKKEIQEDTWTHHANYMK